MFAFIWAEAQDHVIGSEGKMPWHIPDDLKYFKQTTLGHALVMGRKTFASFGSKPLPKRQNIVLTRQDDFVSDFNSVTVCRNVQDILDYEKKHRTEWLFIIGGAEIFKQFISVVDRLYVTKIQVAVAGDTKMPDLPMADFKQIESIPGTPSKKYPHTFEIYERQSR
ncbi:dihydrofolate reductase [Agrilactobacillus yilanensis]|uniref:Dihydrofolate reductase n=1 Tax=Agrilactobacillus yilanensis TaxID=2485997 RepID=A0ABW4J6N2_9LACO|nr:dihydrofolate reductase [Agrilactobacillus yilanensis]